MPNVIRRTLATKYLEALLEDEAGIVDAAEQYESAKAALEVGLRRYTALRDFVAEQLGQSPYAAGAEWPGDEERFTPSGTEFQRGSFRFTGMSAGDAILQVLQEEAAQIPQDPWLPLEAITARLSGGGLGFPEPVQARAINAALLKVSGIRRSRNQNGTRIYAVDAEPDDSEETEDVPFD